MLLILTEQALYKMYPIVETCAGAQLPLQPPWLLNNWSYPEFQPSFEDLKVLLGNPRRRPWQPTGCCILSWVPPSVNRYVADGISCMALLLVG